METLIGQSVHTTIILFFSAAEERAEDDFIRRKIFRRKKVFPTQPSNFEEVPQSGYVRRKVIKPVQIAPPIISTTTELPKVINDENALNRSQDDPRCKTKTPVPMKIQYTHVLINCRNHSVEVSILD